MMVYKKFNSLVHLTYLGIYTLTYIANMITIIFTFIHINKGHKNNETEIDLNKQF